MKAYLKRAVLSAATLFLLLVMVAPVISANTNSGVPAPTSSGFPEPTNEPREVQIYDPSMQPDPYEEPSQELIEDPDPQEEPASDSDPAEPTIDETEIVSVDMPQEDPAEPDFSAPEKELKGKSNPQGAGFWKNLLRKMK